MADYNTYQTKRLNPCTAAFVFGNIKMYLYFLSDFDNELVQVAKAFHVEHKDLFILHCQYHGSW